MGKAEAGRHTTEHRMTRWGRTKTCVRETPGPWRPRGRPLNPKCRAQNRARIQAECCAGASGRATRHRVPRSTERAIVQFARSEACRCSEAHIVLGNTHAYPASLPCHGEFPKPGVVHRHGFLSPRTSGNVVGGAGAGGAAFPRLSLPAGTAAWTRAPACECKQLHACIVSANPKCPERRNRVGLVSTHLVGGTLGLVHFCSEESCPPIERFQHVLYSREHAHASSIHLVDRDVGVVQVSGATFQQLLVLLEAPFELQHRVFRGSFGVFLHGTQACHWWLEDVLQHGFEAPRHLGQRHPVYHRVFSRGTAFHVHVSSASLGCKAHGRAFPVPHGSRRAYFARLCRWNV
eukprot:scaffold109_cov368-Pavlova_lutheri.AAC.20